MQRMNFYHLGALPLLDPPISGLKSEMMLYLPQYRLPITGNFHVQPLADEGLYLGVRLL
jgi:hypothetical protein